MLTDEERIRREIMGAVIVRSSTSVEPAPRPAPVASSPPARTLLVVIGAALLLFAVAGGGYWLGRAGSGGKVAAPAPETAAARIEDPSTPMAAPAKPALTPEEQSTTKEALAALQTLQSVTSVGVTYQDYMRRLGDANIRFDQALTQIKDPEVRASLRTAMAFYEGTGNVWNAKIQKYGVRPFLEAFSGDCQLILDLFNRPRTDPRFPSLPPETIANITLEVEGVPTMMTCASQKVGAAAAMIERRAGPSPSLDFHALASN